MSQEENTPQSPQGVDRKAEAGCPVMHDSAAAHGSESENPAIDSPSPRPAAVRTASRTGGRTMLDLSVLHAHSTKVNPLDEDFDYRKEFEQLDVEALKADLVELHALLPGLVAGRLRALRRPLHPDELARRRHLPDLRRPRWRR